MHANPPCPALQLAEASAPHTHSPPSQGKGGEQKERERKGKNTNWKKARGREKALMQGGRSERMRSECERRPRTSSRMNVRGVRCCLRGPVPPLPVYEHCFGSHPKGYSFLLLSWPVPKKPQTRGSRAPAITSHFPFGVGKSNLGSRAQERCEKDGREFKC